MHCTLVSVAGSRTLVMWVYSYTSLFRLRPCSTWECGPEEITIGSSDHPCNAIAAYAALLKGIFSCRCAVLIEGPLGGCATEVLSFFSVLVWFWPWKVDEYLTREQQTIDPIRCELHVTSSGIALDRHVTITDHFVLWVFLIVLTRFPSVFYLISTAKLK